MRATLGVVLFVCAVGGFSIALKRELLRTPRLSTSVREGAEAPNFTLQDTRGASVELRKMASARTLVLVTFWATWCAPCRTELTQLTDLYTRRRGDGLEILAVNEDDDARQLAAFLEKRALPFPVLVDPGGAVAAQYGVDAFPVSILVDGDGNVLKVIRGASELLPHVVENRLDRLRAAVGGGASHG